VAQLDTNGPAARLSSNSPSALLVVPAVVLPEMLA
jgi:hypothetical protein